MNRRMKKNGKFYILLTALLALAVIAALLIVNFTGMSAAKEEKDSYPCEEPPFDQSLDFSNLPQAESASAPVSETTGEPASQITTEPASTGIATQYSGLRGVWISYMDLKQMAMGKNQKEFTAAFANACDFVKSIGCNAVFVQVRPFADALYPSALFPWSHILTGTQGKDPGYDPLQTMLTLAKDRGLQFHAWLNPYRVQAGAVAVSDASPALRFEAKPETAGCVKRLDNGVYLNPAREEVRALIIEGVNEILANYPVDGIHFDDYFYPTQDASFDQADYAAYQSSGGEWPLARWRQENVNLLVKGVYAAVHQSGKGAVFGISPAGDIQKVRDQLYADVAAWKAGGFVDYICPQIYYGFENENLPFPDTVAKWTSLFDGSGIKLYIGLPFYKSGKQDTWAGAGIDEFVKHSDVVARMTALVKEDKRISGYVLYDLAHLRSKEEPIKQALANLTAGV